MASPFSIFRKNQKMMLAWLTILTVVGFVLLPPILDIVGTGQQGKDPVVVTTTQYGKMRLSYVQSLQQNRGGLLDILAVLQAKGNKAAIDDAVESGEMKPEQAGLYYAMMADPSRVRQQLESAFGGASPTDVVDAWLVAREAEAAGMVVGMDTIREFVQEITRDRVKTADIQAELRRHGVSDRQFFAMLGEMLLAKQYEQDYGVSRIAVTPGERWGYFNRLERMASIEAVAVPVADSMAQVPNPKDEELETFFEKYKTRLPDPASPEPGFRRPHRVAIEFVRANLDKLASPEAIAEAEVERRYEQARTQYDPVIDQLVKESSEKKEKESEKKESEKKEPEKKETENKAPEKKEPEAAAQETKAEKNQPAATEDADDQPLKAPVADPKPAEKKPEPSKTEEEKAKTPLDAKQRFASLPKSVLKEVQTRIRRDIAQRRAIESLETLQVVMDAYNQKWKNYEVEQIKAEGEAAKQKLVAPTRPDLAALAKQQGLATGETGLIGQSQAAATEIGRAIPAQAVDGQLRISGNGMPVWAQAFRGLPEFRSSFATDGDALYYLYWKTEDEKEREPKFTDPGVRDAVLHAWKMVEARKLAEKRAEALAAEARKSGGRSLKDLFADRSDLRVATPPKFSWMTTVNVASLGPQQDLRLSDPLGIELPGEEFMRAVFAAEPGQVVVAFNAPRTIAYVVRPLEFSPSYQARFEDFKTEDFRKYAALVARDRQRMKQAWMEAIRRSAGFEWAPGFQIDAQQAEPAEPE